MDPLLVAQDLHRSREKLRVIMMRDEAAAAEADVFPRSATMRFLLDSRRRGWAAMLLGGLASAWFGRRRNGRRKRPPSDRGSFLSRSALALLGSVLRR